MCGEEQIQNDNAENTFETSSLLSYTNPHRNPGSATDTYIHTCMYYIHNYTFIHTYIHVHTYIHAYMHIGMLLRAAKDCAQIAECKYPHEQGYKVAWIFT